MYFCGLVGFQFLPPMPHKRPHEHYAGRFKYLTYWNLIVQFLFFAGSCIVDLMKSTSSNQYKLTKIRDKLFGGIVLPYGVFVVFMFWGLYSFDRELIFPKAMDAMFPPWLNHVSHTVILPALIIETYILKHRHPQRKEGFLYALAFGMAYFVWTLYLGLKMDIWVYPVLQIMSWSQRVPFLILSIAGILFIYIIGERINALFWGESVVNKSK
ncbi:hypothetical protein JTE90_006680 [Oedothorax gibbosus]|uniref:Androgen-dependent TFPI-regulating protein n=1 Tax=Oedothorax gibbosus TaxID=931172 RepID=A0AAV6V3B1_9ARAC|nr:hypothetical protein JTE90_006680 [Oedothorax gibbosus]